MLSKIMNLDGKKYEFINNEEVDRYYKELNNEASYSMKPSNLPKGEHYGFIAQDMEKEFPELVRTDSITKLKAIDYEGLVPVLLQSIKEQQNQINLNQETTNSTKLTNAVQKIICKKTQDEKHPGTFYLPCGSRFGMFQPVEHSG